MINWILRFFAAQRKVFGVCPRCHSLFRLNEARIYSAQKPAPDWLDLLQKQEDSMERREEKIDEDQERIREAARSRGRLQAKKAVRALDNVFSPRKIAAEDVQTIFHPVDYIAFPKRSGGDVHKVVLLDREDKVGRDRAVQRSIQQAVLKQRYEWSTLRVRDDGTVSSD